MMQNLHITCDNLEQRQNVFNILSGLGYRAEVHSDKYFNIQTDKTTKEAIEWALGFYLNKDTHPLTYTQFMEQYSMQALRKTITATKLSNPELSLKLGHSRKYLTNLLNDGCSTELQNRLIEEINQVMAGTFKTDAEVIAELTEKLSNAQDVILEINEELKFQSDQNIGLTTENQTLRKNAQEIDTELKRVKDDLDYIKEENDKLREIASKQDTLNKSLNAECHELTEQLDIKKHGEITMNQTMYKLRQQQKIHRLLSLVCLATIILLIVTQWGV